MIRRPRNCWTRVCTSCAKFKTLTGGKLRPRFVCGDCLAVNKSVDKPLTEAHSRAMPITGAGVET
jgi:hypothetical protein